MGQKVAWTENCDSMWQWDLSDSIEHWQGIQLIPVGVFEGVGVCGCQMWVRDEGDPHTRCGKQDPRCTEPLGAGWGAQAPVQGNEWRDGSQGSLCVPRSVWIYAWLVGRGINEQLICFLQMNYRSYVRSWRGPRRKPLPRGPPRTL